MINIVFITIIFLLVGKGITVSFEFKSSDPSTNRMITFEKDAYVDRTGAIRLTNDSLSFRYGRASYSKPVPLYDSKTKRLVDFTSSFSFSLSRTSFDDQSLSGDGLAFFLVPFDAPVPQSPGGFLGLFSPGNASVDRVVAVEFDTFENEWDPSSDHVGIDVNSMVSVANVSLPDGSLNDGRVGHAMVRYNSSSMVLSAFLSYNSDSDFDSSLVSYMVDLSDILPDSVRVGFSASTGGVVQTNRVLSWSFASGINNHLPNSSSVSGPADRIERKRKGMALWLIVSLSVLGVVILLLCLCLISFMVWKKMRNEKSEKGLQGIGGPRRFTYKELVKATDNFAKQRKLGEGGFGCVYKGKIIETGALVAVKKLSDKSKQGEKEFLAEVNIISSLGHKNLVKLVGYCNEDKQMLLVYQLMSNGSLDSHLFPPNRVLSWEIRYSIVLGLADAVKYLHHELTEYAIHRDIKASNIMLDSDFNTKLGDFGLARLVDHETEISSIVVGTNGYIAPEYFGTRKATKKSDIYSFGVVALEICCGMRSTTTVKSESSSSKELALVDWVWEMYRQSRIIEDVVDKRLGTLLDEQEVELERLIVVGLWCCLTNPASRPSIEEAIDVLNFKKPLPNLHHLRRSMVDNSNATSTPDSSTLDSFKSAETQDYTWR